MNKLWFKNYKQFSILFLIVCMAFLCLTGCQSKQSKKGKDLQGISEENIWCLSVESFDEETSESKIIDVDINDRKLVVDDTETTLSEEQCKELQELIFTYSYQVLEQEYDYWPHTEEYPAMLVLFRYIVYYGEEKYSADGALCYPNDWEEFLKTLEDYAQAPDEQMGTEMHDTGASRKGTLYFKDYKVVLSCPEVGHPSGKKDWSTSYMDETKNIDIIVDFQFQDEQLDNKIKALKEDFVELLETELWNHEIVCYIADYEYAFSENETKSAERIVAMMPMEDGTYIQIEITGMRKELLDAQALLLDEKFQRSFTIEIADRNEGAKS